MEYFVCTNFYDVNILDWLISQKNFPGNHHSPQNAINVFKKTISSFYKSEHEKKTFIISKLQ
ncbi:27877_t:CDS:1, partial [Dentiscutata erythropus]